MSKALTFEQFMELAKKHYNRGGDAYVECWDRRTFTDWVDDFGPITKADALRMFRESRDEEDDMSGMWDF